MKLTERFPDVALVGGVMLIAGGLWVSFGMGPGLMFAGVALIAGAILYSRSSP